LRTRFVTELLAKVIRATIIGCHARRPTRDTWCDRHILYRAKAAVYGHLHVARTTRYDRVRFEEVSLGHPPELP
jgi:hypothetical protein